jgi:hypothetical protein
MKPWKIGVQLPSPKTYNIAKLAHSKLKVFILQCIDNSIIALFVGLVA